MNGLQHSLSTQPRRIITLLVLFAVILLVSSALVHTQTEAWWFEAQGFFGVYRTLLIWGSLVWAGTFIVFTLGVWSNYLLAMHFTRDRAFTILEGTGTVHRYTRILPKYIALGISLLIGLIAAQRSASAWETVLKFFYGTSFNIAEPIYQRDISFYVFQLPFYEGLHQWLLALILCCLGIAIAIYILKGVLNLHKAWQHIIQGAPKTHLSFLFAGVALLTAFGFWIERYKLLYSSTGVVYGANYTDVHATLAGIWLMIFASLALSLLFIISVRRSNLILPTFGIIVFGITLVIATAIYPVLQQQLIVEPNELAKETPYIENNIRFTRQGYNLTNVVSQPYIPRQNLSWENLQENQDTLRNIRLWDNRPLLTTYRQLQEIRLYYSFSDIDIDRYFLDDNYRQVMLSARELSFAEVPPRAQTWVNEHLKYTHGYGLVMSPVNAATPEGLPQFFIRNVPPETTVDIGITQPRIYYGEETNTYIFTGTTTDEFDYPLGDQNASNRYDGAGGVPMGSFWRRFAYAYDLNSFKILISNYFTGDSRIHYYRNIRDRVQKVAPFLSLDNDPYLIIHEGQLKWIMDAYTTSDRYPYSEPITRLSRNSNIPPLNSIFPGEFNYIRNSVKILIDAYDGTIELFAIDESDPILATYRRIFPTLFQPSSAVPPQIRSHFRYPVSFFNIQAQAYLSYHMESPEVFYNQEDLWRFPIEVYEQAERQVEPYYMIMRLPGGEQAEFTLSLPFTPINRDNMVAWMAARSDGEDYGTLVLYDFPKQELVYGPAQIEARINQDPQISEQFTLWSQRGSSVIRGDLLVIPIEESLLYVEPVYLQAEQAALPELTRVVVAYDERIVMERTLDEALAILFGTGADVPMAFLDDAMDATLGDTALAIYQQLQDAARNGDWAEYGRLSRELSRILQMISQ